VRCGHQAAARDRDGLAAKSETSETEEFVDKGQPRSNEQSRLGRACFRAIEICERQSSKSPGTGHSAVAGCQDHEMGWHRRCVIQQDFKRVGGPADALRRGAQVRHVHVGPAGYGATKPLLDIGSEEAPRQKGPGRFVLVGPWLNTKGFVSGPNREVVRLAGDNSQFSGAHVQEMKPLCSAISKPAADIFVGLDNGKIEWPSNRTQKLNCGRCPSETSAYHGYFGRHPPTT